MSAVDDANDICAYVESKLVVLRLVEVELVKRMLVPESAVVEALVIVP